MVGVRRLGVQQCALARVSLVNELNECVYDKYVKVREKVVDYRTRVSGVTAAHLAEGMYLKMFPPLKMFPERESTHLDGFCFEASLLLSSSLLCKLIPAFAVFPPRHLFEHGRNSGLR